MATRLNKRFILIVSAVIVVLAIGVAGVAYKAISGDAERQARLGKVAEANGDIKGAISRYARAIGKDPLNLEYYDLFENALFKVVPGTRVEATERYNRQYLGIIEQRKNASLENPESWKHLVNVHRRRARIVDAQNDNDMWGDVQEHAQRMVDQFEGGRDESADEADRFARAIRLEAMSMRPSVLKPNEVLVFKSDSDELREADPQNQIVWDAILRSMLNKAQEHSSRGDDRLLANALNDDENGFDTIYAEMIERGTAPSPETYDLLLQRAALSPENYEGKRLEIRDQVYAEIQNNTAQLIDADTQSSKVELQDNLRRLIRTNALQLDDAVELLTPLLERDLLPLDLNMMICQNFVLNAPAFAKLAAERVLDTAPLPVSLQAMLQKEARCEASLTLFDAAYAESAVLESEAADGETPQEPKITVEDLEALREVALLEFEGDPRAATVKSYLDGSIALFDGDPVIARSQFMEISESDFVRRASIGFRFLPRMVEAAARSGERGTALNQLQSFANKLPPSQGLDLRVTIAAELMRFGRFGEARTQLQSVLALEPDNERARELLANMDGFVQAVQDNSGGTVSKDDRQFGRIQVALAEGRLEEARELLLLATKGSDDLAYARLLVIVNIELGLDEEARAVAATIMDTEEDDWVKRALARIDIPDPIERLRMVAETGYEDPSSQVALELIFLQALARSTRPGNERALELLPSVVDRVLVELPADREMRRRLVSVALREDQATGNANTDQAIAPRFLERIEDIETDEVQLSNLSAIVAASESGPVAALEIIKPIIDRGIADGETWFIQGIAYRQLGRLSESVVSLARAVEQSPDDARFLSVYARSLEENGEPLKGLEVLRQSQLSLVTAVQLQDAWLIGEANYGDMKVALRHRARLFETDIEDAADPEFPIIRVNNALEFARLLLIVKPERIDLQDATEKALYSPVVWSRMSGAKRRNAIAAEREARQKGAFEIYDLVERVARSPEIRSTAKIARAKGHQLTGRVDKAAAEIVEIMECCGDVLQPPQRFRLIDLLYELDDVEGVREQLEALELEDDPSVLRQAVRVALVSKDPVYSMPLSEKLVGLTGLPSDQFLFVSALLATDRLDEATEVIAELSADETIRSKNELRYEVVLRDADLQSRRADTVFREADIIAKELADVTKEQNEAMRDALEAKLESKKAEGIAYLEKTHELATEAAALDPRDPMPLLHLHRALRAKVLLLGEASTEADLLANARRVRDLGPMEWRTNRCLVQSHIIAAQPREALTAVEQYIRRGGLHAEARETISRLAIAEGKPGLAIPALQYAMNREPANSAWPRTIAILLVEAGDVDSASNMWWKVLEIDTSSNAIDSFVELEFRRSQPNMQRLREALALVSSEERARPELRGAMAASLAFDGEGRRAGLMMRDAYLSAQKEIDAGADPIVLDRVLTYFFKLKEDETVAESEARLRILTVDKLGAHDFGALASRAMQGSGDKRDLEAAKRYLRNGAALAQDEVVYRKALLHQLSTILYFTQDCDGAIRVLEECVSLGTPQASSLNNLAYMLVECRNDPETGLVYSSRAVRMDGSSAAYLDTHGYILYKIGRLDDAERFLTRAVAIGPSVSNLLHLAQLMHATGRNNRAQILIEKIGKDFPTVTVEQQAEINELISDIG